MLSILTPIGRVFTIRPRGQGGIRPSTSLFSSHSKFCHNFLRDIIRGMSILRRQPRLTILLEMMLRRDDPRRLVGRSCIFFLCQVCASQHWQTAKAPLILCKPPRPVPSITAEPKYGSQRRQRILFQPTRNQKVISPNLFEGHTHGTDRAKSRTKTNFWWLN